MVSLIVTVHLHMLMVISILDSINMVRSHGTSTFANGNVYDGEYKDNKMNGHGTLTFANGDVYDEV